MAVVERTSTRIDRPKALLFPFFKNKLELLKRILFSPNTINLIPNLNFQNYSYEMSRNWAMNYFVSSYNLSDQIDGMDYIWHFFVIEQCCLQSTFFHAGTFVVKASATWTPVVNSNPFGIKAKTWIAAAFDSLFLANIETLDGFEGDFTGENSESKGMDQLKPQARLSIYPNPSNGSKQIIIELKPLGEEPLENAYIGLYTIAGQLLSTQKFEGPEHKLMLTPHHIASGLYLIKLFSNNALIETQKLLINH